MSYEQKYLKYKSKYLELKNQMGSGDKFIEAVKAGDIKTVEEKLTEKHGLLNPHRANINQKDSKTERSPLIIAVENNDLQMVDLLIKYNADLNVIDPRTNDGVLNIAVKNKNMDIVNSLYNAGAEIKYNNLNSNNATIFSHNLAMLELEMKKTNKYKNINGLYQKIQNRLYRIATDDTIPPKK